MIFTFHEGIGGRIDAVHHDEAWIPHPLAIIHESGDAVAGDIA